ncbi:MAG TPA: response regulator [Longimicrobiales bacterium]
MKRILVVEDSPTQAQRLEELLAREYDVTLTSSAEQALKRIGEGFDLVVSDIVMPGMTGYDLCRRIKADDALRELPVLLLTSLSDPMDIVRGLEAGADNYITKPYDPAHLLARIRRVVDQRHLRRQQRTTMGVNISFLGSTFSITSEKEQILDVLLSAVEDTVRANRMLEQQQRELAEAHARLEVSARESARAARISEQRAQAVMRNAADSIFLLDENGVVLEMNDHAGALLGRPVEDALYRQLRDFVEDGDAFDAGLARVRAAGEASVDQRFVRPDGDVVLVELAGSVTRFDEEPFTFLIARDVTERRAAEDRVRRSERQLAEAQRMAKVGSWQIVLPENRIDTSAEMDRIFDLDFAALGTDWAEGALSRVDDSERPHVAEVLRRAMEEGVPFDLEYTIHASGGETRVVHARGGMVYEDGGHRLRGTVQDVTERRQAVRAILERDEMLRAILDAAPVAIIALDREKRIQTWSSAAERIFGWTAEEVIGGYAPHISPEERDSMRDLADRVLRGESLLNVEVSRARRDGTPLDITQAFAPLRDASGAVIGIVIIAADISDRKRAAAALRDSEEQLRQAQRMEAIGRLTGGIAHDFNNMLTAIQGATQLLLMDYGDDPALADELREIDSAVSRAADLTRQLLAFSRKQPMQPRVVDLNRVIGNMNRMLIRLLDERIHLETRLHPELPAVFADAGQMEQVIMNLVVNARDAMPDGGELVVETRAATECIVEGETPRDCVVIAVSDTGTGIDPAVRDRIFDPFFTTKPVGVGTGLGLSTVYGIVKQNRGRIELDTETGRGTTFRILLPIAEQAAPESVGAAPAGQAAGGTETVLLVEDDPAVRRFASRLLQRGGYRVLEAESGEEACRISNEFPAPIHLVVTDMIMPGMSGREVVDYITSRRPDLNVLFISGYSDDVVQNTSSSGRSVSLLEKPFSADSFATRVRELLDAQ